MEVEMFAKPDSFEIFRRFPFVFAPFCPEFLSGRFGRRSPGDILHIFFPIAFSLAIRVTVRMTIMTRPPSCGDHEDLHHGDDHDDLHHGDDHDDLHHSDDNDDRHHGDDYDKPPSR